MDHNKSRIFPDFVILIFLHFVIIFRELKNTYGMLQRINPFIMSSVVWHV